MSVRNDLFLTVLHCAQRASANNNTAKVPTGMFLWTWTSCYVRRRPTSNSDKIIVRAIRILLFLYTEIKLIELG